MNSVEPDYLARTREAWTVMSEEFLEPGRRSWQTSEISWGVWGIPESEVQALGDLSLISGLDSIELGCGTGYVSAWLARLGARPVGIDPTPAQLANARAFQKEYGIEFPLIEAGAENVPLPNESFDLAISEYGASIWADPYLWIPEAARLLRPGGRLVFLRNSPISTICMPSTGMATEALIRDWFGLNRVEWTEDEPEEFHLPTGPMIRLLRSAGFEIEDLIEIQAPKGATTRYEYISPEWAHRWPSEEVWKVRKKT